MTCLGQMHFAGNGTEKDLLVAEKWLELASSAGDIEACYQLGLLMVNSNGFLYYDQLERILMWYARYSQRQCEKAAHVNDPQQSNEFLSLARVRFTQAAGQGHRDAQYELGKLCPSIPL